MTYVVIAFEHDLTVNPCGTPCRTIIGIETFEDATEALEFGLEIEGQYDEVQVIEQLS